jgi:hypothetical protein
MAIQVEVKEAYKMAPAGQFQGVCAEVIDLGHSHKVYKNQQTGVDEPKTVHEIQYVFQLNKIDDETGKRFTVRSKPLNLILSEKSNLRAFLLQWRGHDLTDAELKPPGVDVDLTGKNALVQVVHNKAGDKTYANIGAIMPLMEGMAEIQPLNYEPQAEAVLAAKAKAAGAATNGQNGQQTAPNFSGQQQAPPPVTDAVPGNADVPF